MKKRIKKLPDELKVGEIRISETHTVEVQPSLKIYVNGNDHYYISVYQKPQSQNSDAPKILDLI